MLSHWIWLSIRKGIGPVGCKKLLTAVPDATDLYEMTREQYLSLGLKEMRSNWLESLLDKDLEAVKKIELDCKEHGIRCVTYGDPDYPQRLREIHDPPCVLYCKGTIPKVDEEATIGVVGTRRCSNYGLVIAKQITTLIALSGGIVVSGGARGIDTIALNSALSSVMPVICVLAGGLDEYYPAENAELFNYIADHGCLISEKPPGERAKPTYFVGRNRLISGLSLGVLVVEAPKGSGALTTAELALSQNRDVFTVNRSDNGKWCEGNQELLDAGCEAVADGWDLMSRYAHMFPGRIVDGRGREAMRRLYQNRYGDNFKAYFPMLADRPAGSRRRSGVRKLFDPTAVKNYAEDTTQPEHRLDSNAGGSESGFHLNASVRAECKPEPIVSVQTEHRPIPYIPSKTERRPKPVTFGNTEDIPDDLPEAERRVLSAMGKKPMEIDEIIMKSGMEPTAVSTALTMLQIKKRIIKCYGNSYQRL